MSGEASPYGEKRDSGCLVVVRIFEEDHVHFKRVSPTLVMYVTLLDGPLSFEPIEDTDGNRKVSYPAAFLECERSSQFGQRRTAG